MSIYETIAELLKLDDLICIYEVKELDFRSYLINYVSHFFYLIEATKGGVHINTVEHWKKELPMFLKVCEDKLNEIPKRTKLQSLNSTLFYSVQKSLTALLKKYNYHDEFEIKSPEIQEIIARARLGELELWEIGIRVELLKNNRVKLIKIVEKKG